MTFKPTGGSEGVAPGVIVMDGDSHVAYISAQCFGVILVDDERLKEVVEAPKSEQKEKDD